MGFPFIAFKISLKGLNGRQGIDRFGRLFAPLARAQLQLPCLACFD